MEDRIPRADAKLMNLPREDQDSLWAFLKAGGGKGTLEQLQAEVPLRHGFTVALSSLSEWRRWYALQRRMDAAADHARQEFAQANPEATAEQLQQVGQVVFTSEALETGNGKLFVQLAGLSLERTKLREKVRQEDERLRLAEEALSQSERKIAMLEEKAARAKQALTQASNAVRTGGLSEEALARIEEAASLL